MTTKLFKSILIPAVLLATMSACDTTNMKSLERKGAAKNGDTTAANDEGNGEYSLRMPSDEDVGTIPVPLEKLVVKVIHQSDPKYSQTIEEKYAPSKNVRISAYPGPYKVVVELHSGLRLEFSGEGEATIEAGKTKRLDITLRRSNSDDKGGIVIVPRIDHGSDAPFVGSFGGDHAQLDLDKSGGRLDLDCGSGVISEPVLLSSSNRKVDVKGFHASSPLMGPDRTEQKSPVIYHFKWLSNREIELSWNGVASDGSVNELGMIPHQLKRGRTAVLQRCL